MSENSRRAHLRNNILNDGQSHRQHNFLKIFPKAELFENILTLSLSKWGKTQLFENTSAPSPPSITQAHHGRNKYTESKEHLSVSMPTFAWFFCVEKKVLQGLDSVL